MVKKDQKQGELVSCFLTTVLMLKDLLQVAFYVMCLYVHWDKTLCIFQWNKRVRKEKETANRRRKRESIVDQTNCEEINI